MPMIRNNRISMSPRSMLRGCLKRQDNIGSHFCCNLSIAFTFLSLIRFSSCQQSYQLLTRVGTIRVSKMHVNRFLIIIFSGCYDSAELDI